MNGTASEHASKPSTYSHDSEPPPPQAAALMQHCFSEELLDSTVYFQVMDLGRQLYIWVGTSAAQMGSLCFASPTGAARGMPPVATLVRGANEGSSASLAQRLAKCAGRPVAVAWSLPEDPPAFGLVAERRLMRELQTLQLVSQPAPP